MAFHPPVWLKGMTNATFGISGGLVAITLPQILAEQHVPEAKIATMTAAAMSPLIGVFLLCPLLDVRFTRRWYAVLSASVAACAVGAAVMNVHHLAVLESLLILAFAAAAINQNALGGWLSTIIPQEDESKLSAWFNVANIAGGGLIAIVAMEILHRMPLPLAACLLGASLLLPVSIYPFLAVTLPDARLASESFAQFFAEILLLLQRRDVLLALALFLLPAASFTLTNILGGVGGDFHASVRLVSIAGGAGVAVAGIAGSLIYPLFARRMSLRPLYLTIGAVGAVFTLSLLLLPRTPAIFACSLLGENIFQSLAITGSFAIAFETIGQNNPLAATTFSVLSAAFNLPVIYMAVVDGHAYTRRGLDGSYIADAGLGLLCCALLALLLRWAQGRSKLQTSSRAELLMK
jgi:PAT family beta-lactamase induction signal transducer AmpG